MQSNAQSKSGQQSKSRDLKYEEDGPAVTSATIPRGYALIVGIAGYKNLPANAQLDYPERDADAIYSVLISPEGGNFRAENVHRLTGAKATLANLKLELEVGFPRSPRKTIASSSISRGTDSFRAAARYLAPYDLDPKNISGTGYPMDTLGSVVGSRIKAKWKVLITDSCHSGAITPDADAVAYNRSLLDLSRSMFSLTASRDRERSFESKDWGGGHGIFTYYVVKGLEGEADEDGDGIVTADELADYTRRNVREATKGMQNPTSDRGSFDPKMGLSYIPASLRSSNAPPPKDGTLIFETNMDGVELFVDGVSQGVINKGAPLRLPGLKPGNHTDSGRQTGLRTGWSARRNGLSWPRIHGVIKILILRRRNKAAVDELDEGLKLYNKGGADNYKSAAEPFEKALQIDATYSQAALYLGRAYNSLFDEKNSKPRFAKPSRSIPTTWKLA